MNKIKLLVIGLLLSTTFTMFAQQTVKGVVKEKTTGDTLPGVSVIIKGTTNGSETDFDGRFQISNVKSGDVLVFRSLGYSEKEVTIGETLDLLVELIQSSEQLDEIIK